MDTTKPPVELKTTNGVQHYGSIFSADPRQHNLAAYTPIAAAPIVSYYPNLTGIPVWMQNALGACVGHAAGKAKQVMKFHEDGAAKITPFSARFLYALAKTLEGTAGYTNFAPTASANDGTYPELVAKVMQQFGVSLEDTCPNDTTLDADTYTFDRKMANIPAAALTEAAGFKISNYAFADITEDAIKTAIQFAGENKGGVFMLTDIDKNWWTAPDGTVSWAAKDLFTHYGGLRLPTDAATLGGHETMPYAFDTINGRVALFDFNSWSEAWGNAGMGQLDLADWLPHIKQVITVFDIPSTYTAPNFSYTFTKALSFGMQNSDVVALQHCLKIDGEFPATVAFTGYFGQTTLAAVKAFQAKYAADILTPQGLTEPTGIVGTATIKKLNALFQAK